MKKITLLGYILISTIYFAQIKTNLNITQNSIPSQTPFLDASSSSSWNGTNNQGKGLVFPRTDLTTMTALIASPNGLATSYPTRLDGMVVYNIGAGAASTGTSGVTVAPGFYYYENKTANLNGGTWKPFAPSSAAFAGWALGGNGAEVTAANNSIGTKAGTDVPVNVIVNGNTMQTFGSSTSDASFRKVVINPNGSANTTMSRSKTVGGAGFDFALEVAGKSWFENGIVTSNSTYPDYVFDKYFTGKSRENASYNFLSLAETEKYIRENNHLPGVTSIGDLARGGNGYMIDATQLSVQSLEKIEELYLHIIEQQKQIDLLKQEIEHLKESSH